MKNNIPRLPNKKEKKDLIEYWMYKEGYGLGMVEEKDVKKDLAEWLDKVAIAVFDNYETEHSEYKKTEYSDYKGKLLVIISRVEPEFHKTYIWEQGKIKRIVTGLLS